MGRAVPCGDDNENCVDVDHCTQFGPITEWNAEDWETTITAIGDDPSSTATIDFGGDLVITATVGTDSNPLNNFRTVQVVMRHQTLIYRHYRHQKPFTHLTMQCVLQLAARPAMPGGALSGMSLRLVPVAGGASVGSVGVANIYGENRTRRAYAELTPIAKPPCPPAYVDYYIELVFSFPGGYCSRGEDWVAKLDALEFRIGSNCESYVLPSPGNDALTGSLTWEGLSVGSGKTTGASPPECTIFDPCLDCATNDPVTVFGSTVANTGAIGFSVGFVPWSNCSQVSIDNSNNGSFLYACALAWDGDIGEWAIHHRGTHYLSGHTTRLEGGLDLTAVAYQWKVGGPVHIDIECLENVGDPEWICLETDICNDWPATLSVALGAPP